jgi:uncharacterized membrane protein
MLVGTSPESPDYDLTTMWVKAVILLLAIVAHPIKPNTSTAYATGIGLFIWVFDAELYLAQGG